MSPEARHSALQRLAWRGLDPMTISQQTGLSENEVRNVFQAQGSSPLTLTQPHRRTPFVRGLIGRYGRG
jgi:hypothetical protein